MKTSILHFIFILFSHIGYAQRENQIPNYSFEKSTNHYFVNNKTSDDGLSRGFDIKASCKDKYIQNLPSHEDSLEKEKKQIKHNISFEILGPFFLSSLGYSFEKKFREGLSVQLDFRIGGHVGYLYSGWSIGR